MIATFNSTLPESIRLIVLSSAMDSSSNITYTDNERIIASISQISGILSLSVWLFAQLPQIIENYLNQSVSGVSLLFLICWIGGDTTNLIGCLLTKALPFQTCLASYYCFIDLILSFQYWYYSKVYPKQKVHHNMLQSPNMLRPTVSRKSSKNTVRKNRFEQDMSRSPIDITESSNNFRNDGASLLQKILGASFMSNSLLKKTDALPLGKALSEKKVNVGLFEKIRHFAMVAWTMTIKTKLTHHFSSKEVGRISAWTCSFLYLSSRTPQILKNYHCRSTKGISAYLFLFAMIGNSFYTISIVSDLYLLSKNDAYMGNYQFHEVLMAQLPFIVGSLGTVLFDCIILLQCWYYGDPDKSRNSSNSPQMHFYGTEDEDDFFGSPKSPHTYRHHKKHKDSPLHFQKPDWYVNNHPNIFMKENHDIIYPQNEPINKKHLHRSHKKTQVLAPSENTALITSYQRGYTTLTPPPPPQHYISASSQHTSQNGHYSVTTTMLSNTLNAITKSLSRTNSISQMKSSNSISSMISTSFNNAHNNTHNIASSPLNTSIIPSIIGQYSSISKKMSNDSKIPFSPIDFLNDEFYHPVDGSSVKNESIVSL